MLVQKLEASVTGSVPNLRSQNCRNRLSSASEVSRISAGNVEPVPEPEPDVVEVEVEVDFECCVYVVGDDFEFEGPLSLLAPVPVPLLEYDGGGDRRVDL